MADHLSDCSDDSFEIVSHDSCEVPENEVTSFYKPKVTFREIFDVYPIDSDIVARISLTQDFEKSPEDTVIVMPLAWTSVDQKLCSASISGDYVRFDVNDLPKSSVDQFYQLCYFAGKDKTIEGVSAPFSFREVHEEELIEFQKEQNKEFWTFRSRFAVLMNIYWNSLVESKKILNSTDCQTDSSKNVHTATALDDEEKVPNEEETIVESMKSMNIKDSLPESEKIIAENSLVNDNESVDKVESITEIEKAANVEDSVAENTRMNESNNAENVKEHMYSEAEVADLFERIEVLNAQLRDKEDAVQLAQENAKSLKAYYQLEVDDLFARIKILERSLYDETLRCKTLSTKLQACENSVTWATSIDAECSKLVKRVNELETQALEEKANAKAELAAEKSQWEAEISVVRNRLVAVEAELAAALVSKTDTNSKYTRSLENEIFALKKREETFATKLVEATVDNYNQSKKFEKIQADLEARLKEGAKAYAKLYLKLQKHMKSSAHPSVDEV